jgi:hypothetical protein
MKMTTGEVTRCAVDPVDPVVFSAVGTCADRGDRDVGVAANNKYSSCSWRWSSHGRGPHGRQPYNAAPRRKEAMEAGEEAIPPHTATSQAKPSKAEVVSKKGGRVSLATALFNNALIPDNSFRVH